MSLAYRRTGLPRFVAESREELVDNSSIGNWIFFISAMLSIIGLLFVVDTAFVFKGRFADSSALVKILKELAFLLGGWICAMRVSRYDRRGLMLFGGALMAASLVMLALVDFTPLGVERNGCRRWLNLYICTIQPLEFFKLGLVLQLAAFIAATGNISKQGILDILKPAVTIAVGLLLLLIQPNISAVGIVGIIGLLVALISGLSGKRLIALIGILVLLLLIAVVCFDRTGRFQGFFNRKANASKHSYQVEMALKSQARGGGTGAGFANSIGKFDVPFNDSDFIYTIIVEETGLLGGSVITILFAGLIYLIWRLARGQTENYPLLVCLGIGVMLAVQAAVNIAVNLALMPPTGVPLPFISSGGSSLIITLVAVGILLNMAGGPASKPQGQLQAGRV